MKNISVIIIEITKVITGIRGFTKPGIKLITKDVVAVKYPATTNDEKKFDLPVWSFCKRYDEIVKTMNRQNKSNGKNIGTISATY